MQCTFRRMVWFMYQGVYRWMLNAVYLSHQLMFLLCLKETENSSFPSSLLIVITFSHIISRVFILLLLTFIFSLLLYFWEHP